MDAGVVINPACPLQKSAFWLFWCFVNERRDPGVGVHPNASPVSLLIKVRSLAWRSHRCFLVKLKMCSELKFRLHLLVESRGNQLLMDLLHLKTCEVLTWQQSVLEAVTWRACTSTSLAYSVHHSSLFELFQFCVQSTLNVTCVMEWHISVLLQGWQYESGRKLLWVSDLV